MYSVKKEQQRWCCMIPQELLVIAVCALVLMFLVYEIGGMATVYEYENIKANYQCLNDSY